MTISNKCFTVVFGKPAGKNIGIITEYKGGYKLTDYDFGVGVAAENMVRELNDKLGVSATLQNDMEINSMFFWYEDRSENAMNELYAAFETLESSEA